MGVAEKVGVGLSIASEATGDGMTGVSFSAGSCGGAGMTSEEHASRISRQMIRERVHATLDVMLVGRVPSPAQSLSVPDWVVLMVCGGP